MKKMKELGELGFKSKIRELIIAEKNQQGEMIAEALGFSEIRLNGIKIFSDDKKQRVIVCAIGHLYRCLLDRKFKSKTLLHPNTHIEFRLDSSKKKRNDIIAHFKDAKTIIIATDYDQEGQNIGGLIVEQTLQKNINILKRMKFSSLESSEIQKSYKNLIPFDKNLFYSGQTRMKLDSLYGINLSKWFIEKYGEKAKEIIGEIYKKEGICGQILSNGKRKDDVCHKVLFHSGKREIFILEIEKSNDINNFIIDKLKQLNKNAKKKVKLTNKLFKEHFNELRDLIQGKIADASHYFKNGRKEEDFKLDENYNLEDYMNDMGLANIPLPKKIQIGQETKPKYVSKIIWSFEHQEERCELCQLKEEFGWNPQTNKWDDYTCPNHLFYRVSLSVGRVQSPTMNYIVSNYLTNLKSLVNTSQIKKSKSYYLNRFIILKINDDTLRFNMRNPFKIENSYFFPKLQRQGGAYRKINDFGIAIVKSIKNRVEYNDSGIPRLMNVDDCYQYIYDKLGLEPNKTKKVLESLYLKAFISYPRTDSQKLPKSFSEIEKILKTLQKLGYNASLPLKKLQDYDVLELINFLTVINGAKSFNKLIPFAEGGETDEAHPCIHPVKIDKKKFDTIKRNDPLSFLVLDLIIKRFLLTFEKLTITCNQKIEFEVQTDICEWCGFQEELNNKYHCKGDYFKLQGRIYDDFKLNKEDFIQNILPHLELDEESSSPIIKGDYFCPNCEEKYPHTFSLIHNRMYKIKEIGFAKHTYFHSKIQKKITGLKAGDKFLVDFETKIQGEENYSSNLNYYTQPSQMDIINWMSSNNLGTKSTRPEIINTLKNRAYITEKIIPTSLGVELMYVISKYSKTFSNVKLTSKLEEHLKLIQKGEYISKNVIDEVLVNLQQIYDELNDNKDEILNRMTHHVKCEKHGCPMLIKDYQTGKLLECPYKFIDKCKENIHLTSL